MQTDVATKADSVATQHEMASGEKEPVPEEAKADPKEQPPVVRANALQTIQVAAVAYLQSI